MLFRTPVEKPTLFDDYFLCLSTRKHVAVSALVCAAGASLMDCEFLTPDSSICKYFVSFVFRFRAVQISTGWGRNCILTPI